MDLNTATEVEETAEQDPCCPPDLTETTETEMPQALALTIDTYPQKNYTAHTHTGERISERPDPLSIGYSYTPIESDD